MSAPIIFRDIVTETGVFYTVCGQKLCRFREN